MTNIYLQHHGIKGMKWGVRRYQNKDGTLTAAGKKRYDRDVMENNSKKKDNRIIIDKPDPNRWAREDLNRVKKTVDSGSKVVDEVRRIDDSISKKHRKNEKIDLSDMTDEELRKAINRANMEAQYSKILEGYMDDDISNGKAMVRDVLDVAGDVLSVGASAIGLALAIKELMG